MGGGGAKKPKSKRQSASKQYKISKKVNEHNRKMRKEAKNAPTRSKLKKDPGIPNLFPMKEQLLEKIKDLKSSKGSEPIANIHKTLDAEKRLEEMRRLAEARSLAFQEAAANPEDVVFEPAAEGRKDNSKKAYYKEFQKVVELSDVILEVLDARDPLGCRAKQVEEYVMNAGASKRIILVLNKIDLIPKQVAEKWLKYLRQQLPTVAFKASTQSQRTHLSRSNVSTDIASDELLSSSECLGADNLMQILKNYSRNSGMKTTITVGVIGFPNVGKSSVINSMKRTRVCTVGSTPGITKFAQEVLLDKNIKLLDCPGIVFGRATSEEDKWKVLLRNCVKVELVEDPVGAVDFLLSKCKIDHLVELYNIPYCSNSKDLLILLSKKRGKLRKGGVPDLDSTARSILVDWNSGKIPFYTVPPKEQVLENSSSIVTSWSEEFKLPDIVSVETEMLEKVTKGRKATMVAYSNQDTMDVDENPDFDGDEMNGGYELDLDKGFKNSKKKVAFDATDDDEDIAEDEDDEDDDDTELPTFMEDDDDDDD
ncbi:Guanine nucleotide-binding protein-like 3 [Phlyctochytrium planicorne]|nr:Guanine nucleotide-binding protein-like 3 [Phlyctochytrium planicorne]